MKEKPNLLIPPKCATKWNMLCGSSFRGVSVCVCVCEVLQACMGVNEEGRKEGFTEQRERVSCVKAPPTHEFSLSLSFIRYRVRVRERERERTRVVLVVLQDTLCLPLRYSSLVLCVRYNLPSFLPFLTHSLPSYMYYLSPSLYYFT